MKETFAKINDYTLRQTLEEPEGQIAGYSRSLQIRARITRQFNFLAAQVTTTTRDLTYEPRGTEAGGSSSVASQTLIENFNDIQSDLEIRMMHKKLQEMGGKPPAIDEIMRGLGKKAAGLGRGQA